MQEGRITHPQSCADDRVVLVSRGADGVEAAIRLLQLPRGDIELARRELVLEHFHGSNGRQSAPVPEVRARAEPGDDRLSEGQIFIELVLDDGDAVPGHAVGQTRLDVGGTP